MKKLYIVILLLFSQQLFSQYLSSGIGRWKLGVNIGGLCQAADVQHDVYNLGWGATLEYAAYQNQNSFFGFSLRGRFLNGKTTGYGTLPHTDIISNNAINGITDTSFNYSNTPLYLNNRTKLNEFSLEAMLKWNKLYNNTGLLFYLYLGGGFTNYLVETDQKDFSGNSYDYSLLSSANPSADEIKSLQDGDYETELINPDYKTTVFTPALGIGAGFRITPGLDFALEHKISLPQTDLFDGQATDNGDPAFIQDVYHYTSLGLIFSIVGSYEETTYNPPAEPVEPIETTPIVNTTKIEKPTITLIKPTSTNFNQPNCKVEIVAKIEHVRNQGDITLYQNGNKVPSYLYFYSKPTFKCKVDLKEGNNEFKIIAKNAEHTESKTFTHSCSNDQIITICHKNNDGTNQTISIKESEWSQHASHGDTKGNCPEKQITICHNLPGQAGKTQTITIPESKWNIHKSHGDYLGECTTKKIITICHQGQEITIDEKDWNSHAAHGDTKGNCPQPQVNMVTICHIPPTGNSRITMTIPENEWIVHQAHGDYKGTCPPTEPMTTICHKNPNGIKTSMTIPEFRWNEHFSHGDTKGACPENSFIICHKDPSTGKKSNISITESLWAQHAAHGDTKGQCPTPENKITICHNIPEKPGQTKTMIIPESKWLLHKSHGDTKGNCPDPVKYIQICHKYGNSMTNLTIKESEWAQHEAHGDTKGICQKDNSTTDPSNNGDEIITICHQPPGRSAKQTIQIKESEWAVHAAHGDSKGVCPETMISICHKSGTNMINMTIKQSDWPQHAAHGDTQGNCPKDNSTSDPGTGSNTNNKIKICHYPPGNTSNPQTIEIPESAWAAHAAHGDSKGECTNNNTGGNNGNSGGNSNKKIFICHYPPGNTTNPQTIQIPESAWPAHAAHGDSKGKCSNNSGNNSGGNNSGGNNSGGNNSGGNNSGGNNSGGNNSGGNNSGGNNSGGNNSGGNNSGGNNSGGNNSGGNNSGGNNSGGDGNKIINGKIIKGKGKNKRKRGGK